MAERYRVSAESRALLAQAAADARAAANADGIEDTVQGLIDCVDTLARLDADALHVVTAIVGELAEFLSAHE